MKNKIVMFVMLMFIGLIRVDAKIYKGSFNSSKDPIENVFAVKIDESGKKTYKRGRFKYESNTGRYIYCIEPFVTIKNDKEYQEITSNYLSYLDIDKTTWEKINLLAYYGYNYQEGSINHTAEKWYYITQILIWRAVAPKAEFYFTDSYKGSINHNLFLTEINEINGLIERHYKTPSFNMPTSILENETINISDRNNVLKYYDIIGKNVTRKENTLILNSKSGDINFTLKRKTVANNGYLYVSNESQKIIMGNVDVPVEKNYNLKVVPRTGMITVFKSGEVPNVIDNKLTYEYVELENITFGLYDDNKNLIKTGKTDNSGKLVFDNLYKGSYYIKELSKLDNYEINNNYYKIDLKVNEDTRYIINEELNIKNNLLKGQIKIHKLKESPLVKNNKLGYEFMDFEDITFLLYDANMNLIGSKKTDEEGIVIFDKLYYGKFFIKEDYKNDLFVENIEYYEINITDEEPIIELVIKNYLKKSKITINKFGEVSLINDNTLLFDFKNLKNIIFGLFNENSELIDTQVTDEFGQIIFDNLYFGTYYIKELDTSFLYKKDDELYKVELNQENINKVLSLKNYLKKGKILIKKIDSLTKEAIGGVEFIVSNKDGSIIYQMTTNNYGEIYIDNIPIGIYYIKEIKPGDGYFNNNEINMLEVFENETIDIIIENKKIPEVVIKIPNTGIETPNIIYFFEEKRYGRRKFIY